MDDSLVCRVHRHPSSIVRRFANSNLPPISNRRCAMAEQSGDGVAFQALADEILDSLFAFHPGVAQWMGLHEYDGRVADYSAVAVQARVAQMHDQLARLAQISPAGLPGDAA